MHTHAHSINCTQSAKKKKINYFAKNKENLGMFPAFF